MDNLSAHKAIKVRKAIESVGAKVKFLSPYSPDFNPIENCWSKLKEFLRFREARTYKELDASISEAINLITDKDIIGWFTHSQGAPDAQAWVEIHNQSAIDHWIFHPSTVEEYIYSLNDPNYQPELDLIAVAPDGTFAAFCSSYISLEESDRNGRKEGWIGGLGTRRGFRRQGLGRAMLLAGMQQLKAIGMEGAKLGVDAQNPSEAGKLYESVGFRKLYTDVVYLKNL
jgi:ribosomal protein S18 acetylase RimI-like enzyme